MNTLSAWGFSDDAPEWPRDVVIAGCLVLLAIGGFLAVDPVLGLAALLAATVFVAGLYSTSIAVGCMLLSVPIQDEGAIAVGDVNLTITKLVVGAAALAWIYRVLAEPELVRIDTTTTLFTALVAALLMSGVAAHNLGAWAGEVYRWAVALLVYLMATSAMRERHLPAAVIGSSAVGVIAMSVVGFGQVLTATGPPSFESRGLMRAYASFGEPNPFAGYLEMTVPLLAAFVLGGRRVRAFGMDASHGRRLWLLAAGAVGCGGLALVLTQSRGGLLGMLAGLTILFVLADGWLRWTAIGGIVLAMVLLVVTPLGSRVGTTVGATGPQQVSPATFAVQERVAHWRTGLAMVQAQPVLGVGAGNFLERYREFAEVWRFRISRGHAHNTYIHMAAQAGLLGLVGYLGLLGAVIWRLARAFRHSGDSAGRALIAGALGVTVAVMVHGLFDYLHVLSLGLQLSAVWALSHLGEGWWREPET